MLIATLVLALVGKILFLALVGVIALIALVIWGIKKVL
jgi:hypothetical protein